MSSSPSTNNTNTSVSSPKSGRKPIFKGFGKTSLFNRKAKRSELDNAEVAAPEKQNISILVGSWNVGNTPPPADMSDWLHPELNSDIVVAGVQECQYDPRPNYEYCEDDWFTSVANCLGPNYETIASTSITPMTVDTYKSEEAFLEAVKEGRARSGEIRLSVHVKKEHLPLISNVQKSLKTTGRLGGLSGNKGGLCITFKFGETPFCFVNCHLNAHDENYERRNQDAKAINAGLRNGLEGFDVTAQFPYVFWFGDLNYRVEATLDEVKTMLANKDYAGMLARDQLAKSQQSKQGFYNYKEAPITFAPTFKRKMGKSEYDFGRITSFCDRILYKTFPGLQVHEGPYDASFLILTSDHAPVYSVFNVDTIAPFRPLPTSHTLIFSDLRLEEFSAENSADDASVSLHMNFTFAHLQSVTEDTGYEKLPSPKWKEKPTLKLKGLSFEYLKDCHVLVAVKEEGKVRTNLGEAVISLLEACDGESATFTSDIVLHGIPKGRLSGTVRID